MLQVEVVAAPSAQLHIDSQSLDHSADRSVDFEERYVKQSLSLLGSSAVGWISQVECGGSLEESVLRTPLHRGI